MHFTYRGDLATASIYLPFAKKELQRLKKRRETRDHAWLSKLVRGTDGVLGHILIQSSRTEDWIHIEILAGGPILFTAIEGLHPSGFDVNKIRAHVYHRKSNKFCGKNKSVMDGIFDVEPPILSGGSFWFCVPYGPYIIVQTFHSLFWMDSIIYWLMEYGTDGTDHYILQTEPAGFVDELGSPINRPADSDEVIWSAMDWEWNYYKNRELTSYLLIARTGSAGSGHPLQDPLTISPYIVKRDLTNHIAASEVLYTLASYTQDNSGDLEYWSPNHPGYVSLFGIDQDRIYMTALQRTESGGTLTTKVFLLSIDLETGAVTQVDDWQFTNTNPSGPYRGLGQFMVLFGRDTNVIGFFDYDFSWGGTGASFSSDADVRFYAGSHEDGLGGVELKFTLSDVNLNTADIHFWSMNNHSSWEDPDNPGQPKDNQKYGVVVFEAATGGDNSVKIYESIGGEEPELIKEYPPRLSDEAPFGNLTGVRVGREYCLIIGSLGSRVYDLKRRTEKNLGAAIDKSGLFDQSFLMDPIPMIEAPRRYK